MYTAQGKLETRKPVAPHWDLVESTVRSLAYKLPDYLSIDDMMQVGYMGLMEAQQTHNPETDAPWEAYARNKIKWAVFDDIRNQDMIGRRARELDGKIRRAEVELEQVLMRPPSTSEVCEHVGINIDRYHAHMTLAGVGGLASLDMLEGVDDTGAFVSTNQEALDILLEDAELTELQRYITELPEREQIVLGLIYQEKATLDNVAEILEVSKPRVCQIHARALSRLREKLQA